MALTEPYPLSFLSNLLVPVADCQIDPIRFEEASGTGSGQHWTAEMSDPLWQVSLSLRPRSWAAAREINAKIAALGSNRSMLFSDGSYAPAAGGTAGGGVTVSAIGADRSTLSLTGLPASYRITAGDRLSITHSSGRYYFGVFAESVTANGSGVASSIAIEPPLPDAVATAAAVRLDNPLIRACIPQGNFQPFRFLPGDLSDETTLTLLQKL